MVRAISDNNGSSAPARSEFTPSTATRMLPLVRRIVADMTRLTRSISGQREQIRVIDDFPETMDQADYREELSDIRASLADDEARLQSCLSELAALGLEAHLPFDGGIDFPAILNRRQIRLCWSPDDEQVEYWHEVGQPKSQRQKIDPLKFGAESLN